MARLSSDQGSRPGEPLTPAPAPRRSACRVRVTGLVQGVGFRPFVHRLAMKHRLAGWVRNGTGGVQIEIEGIALEVERFLAELEMEPPPLARIATVSVAEHAPRGTAEFTIEPSAEESDRRAPVSPDVAICPECTAELFDPVNRRYRYPFVTCTNCGPRYTVIRSMPYDRERTSMVAFEQCPECLVEYRNPSDRRYHSETNSCPRCGPRVWFHVPGRSRTRGTEPALDRAVALIQSGGILALRGLGGFHLVADAANEAAVAELRARKGRGAKPLAVMVRTLDEARKLADLPDLHAALLSGPEHPIVLVDTMPGSLAPSVAPGLGQVGLMLAYTPLHLLLGKALDRPLVMTSGNRSEEPIATANHEALVRLAGIADGFLLHDREIVARYDDSVIRIADRTPIFLRRARGYAPLPLDLPVSTPRPLVAVGPELKNTFTLAHEGTAYVSQHIGDLENLETLEHWHATFAAYRELFRIEPEVAVRDLHPGYLSTRVAAELGLERVIAVQHHHAHIAAVLAEHGETGPAIGLAFDGTGLGDDGAVWGGEFLIADLNGYRRFGHLRYAPLPGGDLAARNPWRAALGYASLTPGLADAFSLAWKDLDPRELSIATRQIERGLNAPRASSMGRLFDAAAAVIGLRQTASYEGQAAMELEALAGRRPAAEHPCGLAHVDGEWIVDPTPLLAHLGWRRQKGSDPADLAADFHASIAYAADLVVARAIEETGIHTVVLGGGCWQNARLLESVRWRLHHRPVRVLVPGRLSPNDGAISFGQAAVAAQMLRAEQRSA